jgi:putative phosphoesterase
MLVGVLSDIHDNLGNLEAALDVFRGRGIETLLFLGDFCSPIPSRVLGSYSGVVHCVFGNGDGDRFAIRGFADGGALRLHGEWAELELGGRSLAMTHYPFYARALARTGDYDAVFSGHTHERHGERIGDTLWLNPGEVLGWKGSASVAIWDTESNDFEFVELEAPDT